MKHFKVFFMELAAICYILGLAKGITLNATTNQATQAEEEDLTPYIDYLMEALGYGKATPSNQQEDKTESCKNKSGFFRVPSSCTRYYRCSNDRRYDFECGQGTSYDEKLSICGWPNQVNCKV